MKRQKLALTGLVVSLAVLNASSARAFQSTQTQQITAQATTGGTLSSNFTATLMNVNNTAGPTTVAWTGALPGSSWKIADQMVRLQWSVTDAGGGIQVYTDNTNAAAVPRFVDQTPTDTTNPDSNPAGLLMGTSGTTGVALPVAWSIKTATMTVGTNLLAADPNAGPATGDGNRFQWLYLLDKLTPAIDRNGDGDTTDTTGPNPDTAAFPTPTGPFVQMVKGPGAISGIHFGQADTEFGSDPDHNSYVYLQADFTNAAAQTTYRTSRLTIEAFIQ